MTDRFCVANTTKESNGLGRLQEILQEFRENIAWLHSIVLVDRHLKRLRKFHIAIAAAYWRIAGRR